MKAQITFWMHAVGTTAMYIFGGIAVTVWLFALTPFGLMWVHFSQGSWESVTVVVLSWFILLVLCVAEGPPKLKKM